MKRKLRVRAFLAIELVTAYLAIIVVLVFMGKLDGMQVLASVGPIVAIIVERFFGDHKPNITP